MHIILATASYIVPFFAGHCSNVSEPANGEVLLSGLSVGDTATFTCNTGYELVGEQTISCQTNGTWSNPPPVCLSGMNFLPMILVKGIILKYSLCQCKSHFLC